MKFGKYALQEVNWRVRREAEGVDAEGIPTITVWVFYNVITWFISHRCVSLNHRVDMERRLRNAMAVVR